MTLKQILVLISALVVLNTTITFLFINPHLFSAQEELKQKQVELNKQIELSKQLNTNLQKSSIEYQNLLSDLSEIKHAKLREQEKLIIQSDDVYLTQKDFPKLSDPNGCEANRGLIKSYIKFETPFLMVPEVFGAFTLVDFAKGNDHRLKLNINNVTKNGFEFTLSTWCDTKMSQAKAKWVAIGY